MTLCKLGYAEIEVDVMAGNDGREVLHFRHPIKGIWYASIDTILDDMNNYYEKKKVELEKLVQNIKADKGLEETVSKCVKEKEYI